MNYIGVNKKELAKNWEGLYLLEDNIKSFYLDYHKFCNFLIKHKGFIVGSFSLSCFDNSIVPNDIDIFVYVESELDNDSRYIHKEFSNVINEIGVNIIIAQYPINNYSTKYFYKFTIMDKIIDIIIMNEHIKEGNFDKFFNIQCSNIVFDGIKWISETLVVLVF
jgi:hypothetical protein